MVSPTTVEQHFSLLFNLCHSLNLLKRGIQQFLHTPAAFHRMLCSLVTSKAQGTEQPMDCVVSSSAETLLINAKLQPFSLHSAKQWKVGRRGVAMLGLKCYICSPFPVTAPRYLTVAFKEALEYPLSMVECSSLRILSHHLALYSAG